MINALSNSSVPHLTVIIGASYGAGNYGMGGRAFDTRFTFCWPTAKIAIMGPKQIAGVMSLVRAAKANSRGEAVPAEEEHERTAAIEDFAERQSLALHASGRIADDGVIDPRDTRPVLAMALSAAHSNEVAGSGSYGVFRM
jgi:acetyl-CoA carboxylase carboxyltransferase component